MKLLIVIAGALVGAVSGVIIVGTTVSTALENTFFIPLILLLSIVTGVCIGEIVGRFIPTRSIIKEQNFEHLPISTVEFIKLVIKKMRYRRKVRQNVQAELAAHFEDELKNCRSDEEKEQKAKQLIEDFGDAKLLGVLLRRAKKRCRPLWRTIVARTFQTVGVLILCFIIYTAWFLTGKPTISVDYLALFNQMNQPKVLDEDNAWPNYEKAIALFVEPGDDVKKIAAFGHYRKAAYKDFANLSEIEQEKIRKWVEQNESAWQEFTAGSLKAYCYRQYEWGSKDEQKWLFNILMPHLRPLRDLAKAGIWRSRIDIERGRTQQTLEDCLVVIRAGSHWQGNGILIEQLVGSAVSSLGYEEILHIAAAKKLSAVELKQLQQQLLQIYPQSYPLINMESERLMFLDTVQRIFTEGGPGGGHLIPDEIRWIGTTDREESRGFDPISIAAGMVHARRDETIAKANEIYNRLNDIAKMSPYEIYVRSINDDDIVSPLPMYRYSLFYMLMPAVGRIAEMGYRGKVTHEATTAVLTLQRWQLERGEYPKKLEELVEGGYLKELPMDPFSDKPLVYKQTDDDFALYSVGLNFKDDGGKVVRDKRGRVNRWADEGDAVFWPIQKNDYSGRKK